MYHNSLSAGVPPRTVVAIWLLAGLLFLSPAGAAALSVADGLRSSLADDALGKLVDEVLERNPEIARARQRAAAAAARAPRAKALPDPEVSLTVFALPAETRVGPQRLSAVVSQRLPWFGKLALREHAALYAAAEARADVEALRLRLLTKTRRLFYELSFLGEHAAIVAEERQHLLRHEEVARARYSAGMGLQQEVLKIQADITRTETGLIEIEARRRGLLASLNVMRDRPAEWPPESDQRQEIGYPLPRPRRSIPTLDALRRRAHDRRPELVAVGAEIAAREIGIELAGKDSFPDLKLGLGYTVVGRRRDEAGQLNPPAGNGDDILALSVGAKLPVRKRKLEAALEEALARHGTAEQHRRQILAEIEGQVGEAAARLPLLYDQWQLFDGVLLAQAEEALSSSEAAYTTGKLNALDLLDAEHVLFEVRTAAARTRTDYAIALARLEGAIAAALEAPSHGETGAEEESHDER